MKTTVMTGTGRFRETRLAVAAALLGLAAVSAGPALAGGGGGPPARTGEIHEDCDWAALHKQGGRMELLADCRTSDDSEDTARTGIDLRDITAPDDWKVIIRPDGRLWNLHPGLKWRESGWRAFYEVCTNTELHLHSSSWEIKTLCRTQTCTADWSGPETTTSDCADAKSPGQFDLNSKYGVNSAGKLEIK